MIFSAVFAIAYYFLGDPPREIARAVKFTSIAINRDGAKKTFIFDDKPVALCPGDVIDVKEGPISVETLSGDKFTFKPDGSPLRIEAKDGNFSWKFGSGEMRGSFQKGNTRIEAGNLVVTPYPDSSLEIKAPRDSSAFSVVSYLSGALVVFKGVLSARLSNGGAIDPEALVEVVVRPSTSGIQLETRSVRTSAPVTIKSLGDGGDFEMHGDSLIEICGKHTDILRGDVRRIGGDAQVTPAIADTGAADVSAPVKLSPDPGEPTLPKDPGPENPGPKLEPVVAVGPGTARADPAGRTVEPAAEPKTGHAPPEVAGQQDSRNPSTPAQAVPGAEPGATPPGVPGGNPVPAVTPAGSSAPGPETGPTVDSPAPPQSNPTAPETAPPAYRPPVLKPQPPAMPQVFKIRGIVRLVRDKMVLELPHGASPVKPGDVVKVGSNSSAYVVTPAGVKYVLRENTEFLYE